MPRALRLLLLFGAVLLATSENGHHGRGLVQAAPEAAAMHVHVKVLKGEDEEKPKPTPAKSTPRPDATTPKPKPTTPLPTPANSTPRKPTVTEGEEDCPCKHKNGSTSNSTATSTSSSASASSSSTVVQHQEQQQQQQQQHSEEQQQQHSEEEEEDSEEEDEDSEEEQTVVSNKTVTQTTKNSTVIETSTNTIIANISAEIDEGTVHAAEQVMVQSNVEVVIESCSKVTTLTDRCVVKASSNGTSGNVSVLCVASSKVANDTKGSCQRPIVFEVHETVVATGLYIEYVEIVKETTVQTITTLDVHDNWITNVSIVNTSSSASKLLSLDLAQNNLTSLDHIQVPTGLQKLNLSYTSLEEVVLTDVFSSIRILDVSYTNVTVLETTVASSLLDVRVEYTSLTSWEHIKISSTVQILDIAGNALTNWSYASLPTNLQVLNASSCNITTFSEVDMSSLTQLTQMDFSGSVIEKISGVIWPPKLENLDLGETTIKSIDIRHSDVQIFRNLTTFRVGGVTKPECEKGSKPQEVAEGVTICVYKDTTYSKFVQESHTSTSSSTTIEQHSVTTTNHSSTTSSSTSNSTSSGIDQNSVVSSNATSASSKARATGNASTEIDQQSKISSDASSASSKMGTSNSSTSTNVEQHAVVSSNDTSASSKTGSSSNTSSSSTEQHAAVVVSTDSSASSKTGTSSNSSSTSTEQQAVVSSNDTSASSKTGSSSNTSSSPTEQHAAAVSTDSSSSSKIVTTTKSTSTGVEQHSTTASNDSSASSKSGKSSTSSSTSVEQHTVISSNGSSVSTKITNSSTSVEHHALVADSTSVNSSQTIIIDSTDYVVSKCSEVTTLTDQCTFSSSSNGAKTSTSVLCIASSKVSDGEKGSCKRPIVVQMAETISISGYFIERVEIVEVTTLTKISTLDLHNNWITNVSIVSGTSDSKLLSLDLSHNNLTSVESISIPVGLQQLNVSYTRLEKFVLTERFSSVRILDVSNTKVTELDTTAASQLLEVRVEYSSLTTWEHIKISSTVKVLNVAGNMLTDWSTATLPKDLQVLDASSCNITTFSEVDMSSLTQLTQIDFSSNSIDKISGVIWPPKLENLDLGETKIESIYIRQSDVQIFRNLSSFHNGGVTKTDCSNGAKPQEILNGATICVYEDEAYSKMTNQSDSGASKMFGGGGATNLRTNDSKHSSFPIWAIILACIILLVMVILLIVVCLRRRRRQEEFTEEEKTVTVTSAVAHRETRAESESLVSDLRHDLLLSKWRIDHTKISKLRVVNEGTFAAVYVVRVGKREVVMKQIRFDVSKDHRAIERFAREIRICSVAQHPKIVRFIGYSSPTAIEKLSVYSEYMEKGNLAVFLRQQATQMGSRANFTWFSSQQGLPTKLQIAIDVAEALVYLHSRSPVVIHRDLRAKNVLLDATWTAKITDFGVERELKEYIEMEAVEWLAPEVLRGEAWTVEADIYAFGMLMVELDTFEAPFSSITQTRTSAQLALDIVQQQLKPTLHSDCPASISALIMACLQVQASDRPSVTKLHTDLLQLRATLTTEQSEATSEIKETVATTTTTTIAVPTTTTTTTTARVIEVVEEDVDDVTL